MGRIYSSILKNAIIPLSDHFMGTCIASSYRQIKNLDRCTRDEITDWQNTRLTRLTEHAFEHTHYYRKLFSDHGLSPKDIKSKEDLGKLPVLTKEIIRDNLPGLIPDNIRSMLYKESATGGSTGDPLKYYLDYCSWSMINANNILHWEKTGYNYGDKYIALGSTSLFVETNKSLAHTIFYRLKNKTGLNGINMSDDTCDSYISLIKARKIRFIYGYASSVYLLAKFAIENNKKLDISACFTTSEVLTEKFRDTITKAFRCTVLDCYGANDGGISAFAHEKDLFEVGYNSIVRVETTGAEGAGPALITDLFNYAMPLINYKLGDEISMDASSAGNHSYNGQVINKVFGRTSDIIKLENGHLLTGPGFTILFKDLPVEHYFISKTNVNTIECRIVRLPGYDLSHENLIISTFRKQMGTEAHFSIKYTNEIPLSPGGKRLYFSDQTKI